MQNLLTSLIVLFFITTLFVQPVPIQATEEPTTYSAAVLDFSSKKKRNPELGREVAMLLTAFLSETGELIMVERQELDTVISEQALGTSGTIKTDTAATIGQLTGAKILISGTIMSLGKEKTMIAKIMGTETGRVFAMAQKVGPTDSITNACIALAMKINEKISIEGSTLVAPRKSATDFIAKTKEELVGKKLPTVSVVIPEIHVGQQVIDPAAQTEITLLLQQLGFLILDPAAASEKPAVEITGEAFSETGIRRGDLVSCKGRVEIKIIEVATGKVLAVDRQTEVVVDTSEQIAGKTALQKGAARLLERNIDALIL